MLLVDSNEDRNHPTLVPLLRQHVEVDVGGINQSPGSSLIYPDFVIWGGTEVVGINRKTVGEWLSNSDACISQIQRELAGPINSLVLLIEGTMRAHALGTAMYGYTLDWEREHLYNSMNTSGDIHGTVAFSRRQFNINAKHAQNEQTRLEFMGVQVVHTYSIQDTVSKLIAFHDMILEGKPNNVLSRLIKPELNVRGLTPQETQFARTLMSCGANWGEELALTVASLGLTSVGDLFRLWDRDETLADTMIREKEHVRTRRIGPALEKKLQGALGYEVSHSYSVTG